MKPNLPATACFFRLRTGAARAVAKERRVAGQPVRRFLKELIKAGHYVKEADGLEFDVTPTLLEHWAATFARMRANGLNVPVPSGHTHDGAANRGWVRHLFRAGDSLYGVVDLVGDGIPMAATNDVSIYAVPEFTDGHGNRYQWPILHVALCTDPVVPGLGGFLPIAAALDSPPADAPVFQRQTAARPRIRGSTGVAAGANQHGFPRKTLAGAPMSTVDAGGQASAADQISQAFSQAVLQVLQDDGLDLKAKLARIKEILIGQEKALAIFSEDESPSPTSTQGSAPEGAGGGAAPPDLAGMSPVVAARLAPIVARNRRHELADLVRDGHLTRAAADGLERLFIPSGEKALQLSIDQTVQVQFDGVVAALRKNRAIAMGERTGPQVMALARPSTAGDPSADEMLARMKTDLGL
jgi:hypothetical protein